MRRLSGLLDFESAERNGSFRVAADELHKTAAAVSQQVKRLEQEIGFKLFERHPRQVVATAKGRDLAETLRRVLLELDQKVAALRFATEDHVLRVSGTHSFALKWLAPRLADFTRRHPEIDLRLDSSDGLANLTDGSCDVAIRYSASATEGRLLFQERLAIIYSPALAETVGGGTLAPSDLARVPLIYEGEPDRWKGFLAAQGLPVQDHNFARAFSHAGLLVQAAVAGNGVALAPLAIASADLAEGRLKAVRVGSLPMAYGYRAMVAPHAAQSQKVRDLLLWLEAMFAAMRSGLGEGLLDPA